MIGLAAVKSPAIVFFGIFLVAVGEMISSPRIQEYITWIAPKEKAGLYMGMNFLAIMIGAALSGVTYTALSGYFDSIRHADYVWYVLAAQWWWRLRCSCCSPGLRENSRSGKNRQESPMLIKEKVEQAVAILQETGIDCWITFVRETGIMRDPMMDFLCEASMTWHSAFIVTRSGKTCAIVGQMEKPTIDDMGVYHRVLGYVEGIKGHFLDTLKEIHPSSIAVNYSEASEVCDGLTHVGMYLTLHRMLCDIGFEGRIVPAEKIASRLKARKTASEIARMKTAINHTLDIFSLVTGFIRPEEGQREIATIS